VQQGEPAAGSATAAHCQQVERPLLGRVSGCAHDVPAPGAWPVPRRHRH
jgi:hypothetical protein